MKTSLILLAVLAVIAIVKAFPAPDEEETNAIFETHMATALEEDHSTVSASVYSEDESAGVKVEEKGDGGPKKGRKNKEGKKGGRKDKGDKKGKRGGGKKDKQEGDE